jgi:hypothetical protein
MTKPHEVSPEERRRMQAEIQHEQPAVYTLADYERAKADLAAAEERWDRYTGNNANKGLKERDAARRYLRDDLKRRGLLPMSDAERLQADLDRLHPNARSRKIVEYNGVRYQRRYRPAQVSNSGKTVKQWEGWWEPVRDRQ